MVFPIGYLLSSSRSISSSAIAIEDVAAGEGAFLTQTTFRPRREVIEQFARCADRRGAYPGSRRQHVLRTQLRHVPLSIPDEHPTAGRPSDLGGARAPVPGRDSVHPAPAEDLAYVGKIDVAALIALAGERKHRVRAHEHRTVDRAREVHAEERQPGIGYRVDESSHQVLSARAKHVVLAAERDDPGIRRASGGARQLVGVQTGTDQNPIGSYYRSANSTSGRVP